MKTVALLLCLFVVGCSFQKSDSPTIDTLKQEQSPRKNPLDSVPKAAPNHYLDTLSPKTTGFPTKGVVVQ